MKRQPRMFETPSIRFYDHNVALAVARAQCVPQLLQKYLSVAQLPSAAFCLLREILSGHGHAFDFLVQKDPLLAQRRPQQIHIQVTRRDTMFYT